MVLSNLVVYFNHLTVPASKVNEEDFFFHNIKSQINTQFF